MFVEERLNLIIEILERDGRVRVKDLSKQFKLSEDAIRKDLQALDKAGLIKRIYGGAILKKSVPTFKEVSERTKDFSEDKMTIAKKAFKQLQNHETILLDISSTNVLLADLIKQSDLNLNVISNSVDILYLLSTAKNINLIALGGMMFDQVGGFVGSETIASISKYNVDKLFLGCVSVDINDNTIATFNVEDGNTKASFINNAKHTYLMLENKKFNYSGVYKYTTLTNIDSVITEKKPTTSIVKQLNKYQVEVI